jgi:TonB-linked SusC/RagA family outer membrane protein
LRGTGGGSLTNNTGAYSFVVNTAPGAYTVEVEFIGRETVTQAVQLGSDAVVRVPDIQMRERALALDAVIVTGTAAPTARRAIGNAVSTVSSADLASTPATTIDQALQGRVSGAVITSNTGTPGGGVSVRLRGTSSITGGAEPLYIIDGVIIDNNGDQQLNLGYRSNASNRLADLDPNDIERIEILKGAAAAALYGSRANNGVVQIFTRRGTLGEPVITVSSRFGRSELERRIDFAMTPLDVDGDPVQRFDPQDVIFRDGNQMEHHVSLSGGGGETRYYLSGGFTDEEGIMIGAGHDKLNVRMNVDQGLGNFQLSAGANYIRSHTDLVINGEQGEGGLLTGIVFTPTNVDLTARNPETGELLNTAFVFPNPLEVVELWDMDQSVNRFIGSLQGRWAPLNNVNFEYRLGYDDYQMETSQFIPRGVTTGSGLGRAVSFNRYSTLLNNDLIGSVQWGLSDAVNLTTSGGMNHTSLWTQNLNATATDLGPVTELVSGVNMTASQRQVETATLGFFGQQQVAWADRVFLTGALRMDASSTFGPEERWQMYPKVSGSWVLSEEPFMEGVSGDWLTQLRLRGALGYAGNQPPLGSAYARFSRYGTTTSVDRIGLVPLAQSGNPELKPERQREYELGFDLSAFDDRAALAFTYYNQYTTDLLLSRPFAPSTGVGSVLDNVGELSNVGVELQLNTVNVQRGGFSWASTLIYSRNENKVEKLEGDPYFVGYGNRIEEGQPIGMLYMTGYRFDENGQILSDDLGPIPSASRTIVGNPWPEWTGSLSNEFTFGGNWSASFLLDGQFGHELWNQTQRIMDLFGAGPKYDELLRGEVTSAERVRHQAVWANYVEDASFVKLRQLALRYSTRGGFLRNIGAGSMHVEILGRNLMTWTDYTGYDPEINMFGLSTVERGVDFAVYPNARTYTLGVRLTY